MKWTTDEFTGRRFGKYEVLCRLAIGGMAEIFLGFARSGPFVGRPVVIKRILNEQREDSNALQMLLDEAKMTATLSHPNVAQVMDLESDGEEILLVIEFITGANLEEIVEAYTSRQEPVPLGFVITVIREAAQGLGHAHAHKNSRGQLLPIVHRDVTPRNVMVDFEGATKVLDFGIARAKGSERRTQAGMVRGTTAYMSPEQAVGKELDPRTDLFSLGTLFHELLVGQRLFYKGNPGAEMAAVYEGEIPLPSKVHRRVPKALDEVVMRMLERKLEKRYQNALEFIRDLSLAAGSTAWSKERCAELVRERFSSRQKEIEKLVVRIPNRAASLPSAPMAPAYPGGRSSASKPQLPPPNDFESGERTIMGAAPLSDDRRPTLEVEPGRDVATDPRRPVLQSRPVTPGPQPPTRASSKPGALDAAELFDQGGDEDVRTRIIPGGSIRSAPRVSELPTDPLRAAVPRPRQQSSKGSSKGGLILAASGALLLGAAGGAFIFRSLQAPALVAAPASLVHLSLSSDRPAAVWLGKQELGATPISVFVPSGRHLLELREQEGPRRSLELNLPADEIDARRVVTLDSLPQLP